MTKTMALWAIGIGFIVLAGGILSLGYSSKGIKPAHWIAIFVVVGGVATLFKEIGSSEKTDSIKVTGENTNSKVIELQNQNEALMARIESQAVIIDNLKRGTEEQHSYHTGGDSYCYLDFNENPVTKNVDVLIIHVGKHPIRGVTIYLLDASSYLDGKSPNYRLLANVMLIKLREKYIETVKVGLHDKLCTIKIPSLDSPMYWIADFQTDDGKKQWYQRILFKPTKEVLFAGLPFHSNHPIHSSVANFVHVQYSQTYNYIEENTPGVLEVEIEGKKHIIPTKETYTQEILRETPSVDSQQKKDLSKHATFDLIHIGYNDKGYIQKVIYPRDTAPNQ